ncbi:hypothetical protein FSB78_08470 [Sphingomonas ginsenosidivorax]|uniref:Uncharacterized protein n=1 Tax=Sphingomonas ginsenosidivorax TaxID=862135 RepID=A0A5C6UFP5_9SPHN|nr:hypothetical protein [Sphingomonas ginsenosidivorax]TXC70976.1 hypothetical protein FSB78_08470 [Sphingomonas ginsenosidivorax]
MTDWDEKAEARKLHDTLQLVGLRAHATAVGFIQLCAELLKAGVIDDPAVSRIKDAIAKDIIVTRTTSRGQAEFETSLRRRLDTLLPTSENAPDHASAVGTPDGMRSDLDLDRQDFR